MRPSGHLSSAVIVWTLLSVVVPHVSFLNFSLFLTGAICLDIDLLAKRVLHQKNHRRYLTHYPIFWFIIGIISYTFSLSELFYLSCGALTHLLTDFIDWGIPLAPTSSAKVLPHILHVPQEIMEEKYFSSIYWSNKVMKILEILFFIFALGVSLLLPEIFFVLFMTLGCVIYPLSLWDYHRGKLSLSAK